MNIAVEPSLNVSELEKIGKLSSLDFAHYWIKVDENGNNAEKIFLFKAIRVLENLLVHLMENSAGDSKDNDLFANYMKLGHVNLLAKDFAKALSAYQKAYNLNNDRFWKDPSSFFGLGMVYFHFRANLIATEAFNQLLFTFPNLSISVEVHARLGFLYKNLERFELALKHFNAAVNDVTESSFLSKIELRFHIAHCYDCAGDLDRAFNEYHSLTAVQSNQLSSSLRAQILRQLGWICYRQECPAENRQQKIFEAEQYLIQSRDLEPSCGKTYYYLGRCYGELPERAHDAFANYRHSIDKSEADADTWCSIGVLYQQQTQPMDALQAFICAVQLDNEHSAAWSDLGRLYEVNCQFSDALRCFKKALKYRPVAPEALKARIRVLEKELHPSLIGNPRSLPPNKLPGLDEAWRLPIPAELSQRQEEFLKVKQQRYRDGVPLITMDLQHFLKSNESVSSINEKLLEVLRSNKSNIAIQNPILILHFDHKCNEKKEEIRERKHLQDSSALPLVSQDDVLNILGSVSVKQETINISDTIAVTDSSKTNQKNVNQEAAIPVQVNSSSVILDFPHSFSLTAKLKVSTTIVSSELMEKCRKRFERPNEFAEIFDERVPPPKKIFPKIERLSAEKLLRQTPVIIVESRKDAHSFELQNFCYNNTITLVRGLTTIEIKTQYRMPSDFNVDHLGNPTWACCSTRSFSTITKYAQYQAQSFQHAIKEEAEKLRAAGAKYGSIAAASNETGNISTKRRRSFFFEESSMPMKILKYATNIDLSDEKKFKVQLAELNKLPAFCRLVAASNMLTHLGHIVYGMNTVQMFMKVPGARISGHLENSCFASININIGPGECEWFAVPYEYWPIIDDMLRERGLEFLKGSWWPDIDDLLDADIPIYRFVQKAGDLVWVGSGCIYWVQSLGWCNKIAWNVGPLTAFQLQIALDMHEWNRLHVGGQFLDLFIHITGYKSLVPMQHLCWQMARNVRFSNRDLFVTIKQVLIRSLAYCKMIAEAITIAGKPIKMLSRQKGEASHYCSVCEIEVWNLLFVREVNGKYPVYCVQCARKADFTNFAILQQYTFDDLSTIFDQFRLYPIIYQMCT
ncbi:unnamed protein product [Dracunculus medinensis]|uniref:JmjC domain-containing protein n=1 Tax=Dracunculus medinensis TaxID=318479 RepID=A0A0N4UPJ9_DRAME|nr:unnamed protein product [Dracunculus medinensis]